MAQATEIKKNWTALELIEIGNLEIPKIPEVEEKPIEKEIKKGKQVKLKKFNKLLSKITKKSRYNGNYMKEQITINKHPIKKLSNATNRTYIVY